ncbi:MAG: tRNA preQ1(34) S-adenosylmethionine ribosyltransferase-isomerase QueA [Gammaproteobacteria bacterium]|nr:MAG: tRNA preQ1(34) S-adenosylmethionine ribosyltransferase-isomerase QueA [Gammaproteobacteria bacterium]
MQRQYLAVLPGCLCESVRKLGPIGIISGLISATMKLSDFHYHLPEGCIAQYPLEQRGASRLLMLDGNSGMVEDRIFGELPGLLCRGDLLVFNDTRVIPARLLGEKDSGGKVEVLVERVLDNKRVLAHIRASKSPRTGRRMLLENSIRVEVLGREADLFELQFNDPRDVLSILNEAGHVPLPPYIARQDNADDRDRYQTVYARHDGAVAAPTAGLHFDEQMLQRLKESGINTAMITLHVGAGTFQPVRVDDINSHRMHSERITVSQTVCDDIARTRQQGGRVIAVGTTVTRALESSVTDTGLAPFAGETDIFIYPGFEFQVVDAMLTNFHLPESTLLMLVSAFAGHDHIMNAYTHAVDNDYRFFSYGDAMLITRQIEKQVRKCDVQGRTSVA